jgi:hypothetical protein
MKTFKFNSKINDLAYDELKFLVANSIVKIFLKYFLNFFQILLTSVSRQLYSTTNGSGQVSML